MVALWFGLAFLFLASCAPRRIPALIGPDFQLRPLGPDTWAVTAPSVRAILEKLGCGMELMCTVSHAGEVVMTRQGHELLLIQIPLRSTRELMDAIGCKKDYICTVNHRGEVLVVKRKLP